MRQLVLDTSWGELRLVGGSRAGEGTILLLPQLRLALDAGRPSRALVPLQRVLVSHGHLDHLLGVLAWASQRHLQRMGSGEILAPASVVPGLRDLLEQAAALEGGEPYDVTVTPVRAGDVVRVHRDFSLELFPTSHWVETLGCRLMWTRRRIRPELEGCAPDELRALRDRGETVTHEVSTPVLAYLADTGPEVFDAVPGLAEVEVLVTECTFLRPSDRERARRFGHTHLDDIVELAPRLGCRHLVLTHLSRRHRLRDGARKIGEALAGRLTGSLHLLNVEWL